MELVNLLLINLGVIAGVMLCLWLLSLALGNSSIVDIFWGAGFVVIAWVSVLCSPSEAMRKWIIVGLASLWGLRLTAYLAWRNIGKGEDYRYRAMRDHHRDRFWIVSLYTVFGLQGVIMWIVALPLQAATASAPSLNWLDGVGIAFWGIGLTFETLGDFQLARFKADPANRGRVCERGLWRYTRHPNYFGDFMVWWGFFLIALAGGAWWTIVSPLLMSLLLIRVSGAALLEKSLKTSKPGYDDYVRRTSNFFPWPPKAR
jgi:steroid 5-alpha reductase family enzyme